MKLWLLKYEDASYCDTEGFVIRAETEEQARKIAIADTKGDEYGFGEAGWGRVDEDDDACPTSAVAHEYAHDTTKITCVEISVEGEPGVVLRADVGS